MIPKPADAPTPSLFSLQGRVCLITGGARGIGLAITTAFAEAGASGIAITYTSSATAPELAETLSAQHNGTTVKAYKMDVRSAQSVAECFAQVKSDFGRVDVVVANAGVSAHVDALDMAQEAYKDVFDVNVHGVWYTAQEAGRIFKAQAESDQKEGGAGKKSPGNFIVTASVSALLVNIPQKQAAYNASKAAVVHMAKSLAVEWAAWGGRANAISPGFIETDSKCSFSFLFLSYPSVSTSRWAADTFTFQ
jgi:sorbose reductase